MNHRKTALCLRTIVVTTASVPLSLSIVTASQAQSTFEPSSVFVQGGTVGSTRTVTAGATWDWGTGWTFAGGKVDGYTEASLSGWSYRGLDGDRRWLGQAALKPVFRYRFSEGRSPWFAEAGIGLTLTNRLYVTDSKRFSTAFNFGDHLGFGRSFGPGNAHEIALRVEHFSNGGIKEPNPGATFVQLRYAYRLN